MRDRNVTLQKLKNLADRPGTEHEGDVARSFLKKMRPVARCPKCKLNQFVLENHICRKCGFDLFAEPSKVASVAQSAERIPRKDQAVGSTPIGDASKKIEKRGVVHR